MNKLIEKFENRTNEQMAKISHLIGKKYKIGNRTMVLHSCNDLGVPYFTYPNRKTTYCVADYRHISELLAMELGD